MAEKSFGGGGELGGLLRNSFKDALRSHDWSQTPLGAVETWSDDLKTAVQILLAELDQTKLSKETQPDTQEQKNGSAEATLHQVNQLNAFRVKLADALRPLTDASEIQAIAARILGESLGASRVIYVEVMSSGEEVVVHCNYTNGVAQLSGRYRVEDYRRNLAVDHQAGHTQVVTDIPNDPKYTDAQKTRYREIDIAAHIDVPLIKNNQFVALLAAQQSTARQWTETEVKLVEETAEQTWATAERAYAEAALRESEAKYRTLFESIDQGFCVIEVLFDENSQPFDYRFLEINPAFEKQTGLIDAQGKRIRELAPNHEGHWFEMYGNIATSGEPKRFENRAAALNRWYDVYAFRIGHPDERKVAVLFNDISEAKRVEDERKQAEIALQQSEAQSKNILESITDGFFALDQNWRFTYMNPQAERILDQTRGDLLGKVIWEVYPGTVGTEFERAYRQTASERVASSFTSFYPDHNCWYEAHAYPAADGITVYFRNVTEQVQAEAALRESEEKTRNILESIEEAFFALDQDWRFTYMNRAGEVLLDRTPGDLIGKNFWEEYPGILGNELAAIYRGAMHDRVPGTLTSFYPDHDRWYNVRTYPAENGIAVYFNNVTVQIQAETALRESEERFRNMADNAPVMVWVTDSTGYCTYLSRSWYEFTGQTEETGLGFGWLNAVHPEDCEDSKAIFLTANERYEAFQLEYRLRCKDGEYRWAIDAASPWFGVDGQFKGFIGSVIDISARKQAEEALREREQRLSIATEAAQLGIFEWRVPEDITTWENERQYEMFGLTPAHGSVSAQEFFENYLHPDDAEALTAKLTEAMQTRLPLQTSYRIYHQDGTTRWLEVNGQFEFATDGSPVRFLGVNADITDRKQAEAIITTDLKNTRLLRDLSARMITEDNIQVLYDEIMAAAITLTRADAGTVQILDKVTQELVLLASQGFDQTITDHFERVNASSNTSCGLALLRGTRAFIDFDMPECDDPCGALRMHVNAGYLCAQSTPLLSRSGRPMGMVSTHWRQHHRPTEQELRFLDLLARQAADLIEQRQTQAERRQVLEREQAAREEAERANRIKDEFLAMLSHELRSPLNPILGWTQLLQNGKLDEARRAEALKTIERNAKLQKQLIEDLLDISGIMQGKLSLTAAPVSLTFVISAAIETVRLAAEAKHIRLQLDLENTVAPISGDAARLQQVVWNLLSNAVKFTPNGGQVTVELRQLNQLAQIRVIDTGKGINPQFLPYMFEYFRQEDGSTTRKFGGLGLGLAIARQIVEMHGGTVQAQSFGEGQGATLIVQLPAIQVAPLVSESVQTPQIDPGLPLEGIHILLVDDELDTREFQAFLLEQSGAKVTAVASGLEALQGLEQSVPDLLVSDIGMPQMDGYMLIEKIRSRPLQHGGMIPAIALTAYAAEIDQYRALQVGFQTHITKPVEPEVLVRAIAVLLQPREQKILGEIDDNSARFLNVNHPKHLET
ncbi:MAG: PAS domain S-box protein [Nostoc desertorum CM1-VF14]|nr:PAS domain S-box protein [Nostoc desertorum CM1-VF14]